MQGLRVRLLLMISPPPRQVGDSSAIWVTSDKLVNTSTDHRVDANPDEQERIRQCGGKLAYAKHPTGAAMHFTLEVHMEQGGRGECVHIE